MVSIEAKSDECIERNNYLLPAGEGFELYHDLTPLGYNDEVTVCVAHNDGARVRIEDGNGQELFTLESGVRCEQYQGLGVVRAICQGVGSDHCNISWEVCGESPKFLNPELDPDHSTTIDDLASDEDEDEIGVAVESCLVQRRPATQGGRMTVRVLTVLRARW